MISNPPTHSLLAGVIDYGGGNLQSVLNALRSGGKACRLVRSPDDTHDLDALVFPGQGTFGDSVRHLRACGLWDFVAEWVRADRPFLGICLGYQLLFESSDEAPGVAGLGVLPGRVVRFPSQPGLKVPHIGWNIAQPTTPSDPFWNGIPADGAHFYFVHSYFPDPADQSMAGAWTHYGIQFASAIIHGNLVATQFHPEKSQSFGLRLLDNFFDRARAALQP